MLSTDCEPAKLFDSGKMVLACDELQRRLVQNIDPLPLNSLVSCRPHKKNVGKKKKEEPQVINLPLSDQDLALVMELQSNKV